MKSNEEICFVKYVKIAEAILNNECVDDYAQEIFCNFQEYLSSKLSALNNQFLQFQKIEHIKGMVEHPEDWYESEAE